MVRAGRRNFLSLEECTLKIVIVLEALNKASLDVVAIMRNEVQVIRESVVSRDCAGR